MSVLATTTGSPASVVLNDLNGRTLLHPTVELDLELEFDRGEITGSADLGAALDAGAVTLKDDRGNVITSAAGLATLDPTGPDTASDFLFLSSGAMVFVTRPPARSQVLTV